MATPIGNLGDVTLRALDVLARADIVVCEDTRISQKLLAGHGLKRKLQSYHEHNAEAMRPRLIEALKNGASVAMISDAGMPLISDPGHKLVRSVIDGGLPLTVVPGASASLAALVLSGLPSDRFFFAGFLPPRSAARRTALEALAAIPGSLVFYESPKRLAASLTDMATVLGQRPAAVARELTKRFEELRRDDLHVLAAHYASDGPPKGEVVVVVGPPEARAASDEDLDRLLRAALAEASLRDAVANVVAATGLPRRQVYQRALALGQASDKSE